MDFRSKKPLRKLSKNEFNSDVKKFIRSAHKFYDSKIPEMKTLAKKMQEEYELKEFYKVFRRLWNSGYHSERSLAIKTLLTSIGFTFIYIGILLIMRGKTKIIGDFVYLKSLIHST